MFGKIKGIFYIPCYLYFVVPCCSQLIYLSILFADGVNVAASHPLISGSLAFGVGIFALKSTFSGYYYLPRFQSPRML